VTHKPQGWKNEPARHSLAAKGVPTKKAEVHHRTAGSSPRGYLPIEGRYEGLVDHGTIISLRLKDSMGRTREYFGERRMMLQAADGLEKDAKIRVNFKSDWDWYLERLEE